MKFVTKQSINLQALLRSVIKFAGRSENLNKCCGITKFVPCLLTNDQSLWLITWLSFPIILDLDPPGDFTLFPKLKMEVKGCFETVSNIQGNCGWYSNALWKMTSTVLLKCGKNYGITVYICKIF
jgi:hypothetical protein